MAVRFETCMADMGKHPSIIFTTFPSQGEGLEPITAVIEQEAGHILDGSQAYRWTSRCRKMKIHTTFKSREYLVTKTCLLN